MEKKMLLKITVILILVFQNFKSQSNNLEYQNDHLIQNLGIGLIQLIKPNEKIKLFTDSSLKQEKHIKVGNKFIPILNKPDYGILFFICVEKKPQYYKMAISKDNYVFIKSSENIIYYNWENFLKSQVVSIESKNLKNNYPRITPNGKRLNIKNLNTTDEIEIIKVENNWLQIKNITQNNKIFWIEWRNDKELKVYLNLLI